MLNKKNKVWLTTNIGTLYFPQIAGKLLQEGILQKTTVDEAGSGEL